MRIVNIQEQPNGILITLSNSSDYFIPKMEFESVIMGNISDWVHQVMGKKWADVHSLYKIGSILSKYCDGSGIDWVETFQMVENRRGGELKSNAVFIKQKLKQFEFGI